MISTSFGQTDFSTPLSMTGIRLEMRTASSTKRHCYIGQSSKGGEERTTHACGLTVLDLKAEEISAMPGRFPAGTISSPKHVPSAQKPWLVSSPPLFVLVQDVDGHVRRTIELTLSG